MEKTRNILAIVIVVVGAFSCLSSLVGNGLQTAGETVQQWDPAHQVAAEATRTAIPLQVEPTRMWIMTVVPAQQKVELDEITATTKNRYHWQRVTETARAVADVAVSVAAIASMSSVTLGICVAFLAYSWERMKRAHAYEPVQRMPDSAWYMPRHRQLGDTRSGIGLLAPGTITAKEQTAAVREFRGIVFRSVAASLFDALLRRKQIVNQWRPEPEAREIVVQ